MFHKEHLTHGKKKRWSKDKPYMKCIMCKNVNTEGIQRKSYLGKVKSFRKLQEHLSKFSFAMVKHKIYNFREKK